MSTLHSTIYATTDTPLGNGAFTADGRLVVSHHPMYATPYRVSIFEADGSLSPFPNIEWNTPGENPAIYLDAVLGLHDDSQGRIWLADMGTRSGVPAKLVVWDTVADRLWRVIPIPPETMTRYSEPNDFVVDEARGKVYIADEGAGGGGNGSRAALIIIDIPSGRAERRLEGFDGIKAEKRDLIINGQVIAHRGDDENQPMRVGVDGIAMDARGEWLYLSPLNGHTLWRLRVDDLLDATFDDVALAKRLERFAAKPNSGGMAFDDAGNLYLTVIETNSVGRITPGGRYDAPVVREDMFWPDGLMKGPDGGMYVVCTQLPRSPALARPGDGPVLPFKVFRFEPDPPASLVTTDLIGRVVAGVAAGIVASLAVSLFQAAWNATRLTPTPKEVRSPPEVAAERIAEFVSGNVLTPGQRRSGGEMVHFATGAGLGAVYGGLSQAWPAVRSGNGAAFGLGVCVSVGEVAVSLSGLKPPLWQIDAADHALEAVSHLVFGTVLDAVFTLLSPDQSGL